MNVRTKIILLLLVIVTAFIVGLVAIQRREHHQFRHIIEKRVQDQASAFDQFSQHWGESLNTFVSFVSCWDEMVAAIAQDDLAWSEKNLSDNALTSYRSQAAWIYKSDGTLFYTQNVLYSDAIPQVPLDARDIADLIQQRKTCHFFVWSPVGLLEIRGSTIHPSRDTAKKTPPAGYFFLGRVWTNTDIREIALFTGNKIELIKPQDLQKPSVEDARTGTVSFVRPLAGWDGRPAAGFRITNESPVVAQLRHSNTRGIQWMIVFALVVSLLMAISLMRWVTRPLRILADSLRLENSSGLESLEREHGEFGDFARLISRFFEQRKDLLREMEDRRTTEKALRDSEEQLRHSQKMDAIGQLAGGIAHDFNNLLTAIIGYTEMLQVKLASDPAGSKQVAVVLKAGQQAAALTRQLLAFSRKQLLQPRVVDLNALVEELEHLLTRLLGETVRLRVETADRPALVLADPTQLEQVIINLCVNARDAMPQGGSLTIRTSHGAPSPAEASELSQPEAIYLSVTDDGTGMDARTRERIFEPFFTTKEVGKGTGLGLATVYGIVQQSGGTIWVESEVGQGTTFFVSFPAETGEPTHTPGLLKPAAPDVAGETLLVVEDEEIVRSFVCAALSDLGYNVICAGSGQEGLQVARDFPGEIDLLISDVIMPDLNGPELARRIYAERPEVRVLFVSGYSDTDLARHGELPFALSFLEKPFTPVVLHQKIREVLASDPRKTEN